MTHVRTDLSRVDGVAEIEAAAGLRDEPQGA